jgi:hypothetical protein
MESKGTKDNDGTTTATVSAMDDILTTINGLVWRISHAGRPTKTIASQFTITLIRSLAIDSVESRLITNDQATATILRRAITRYDVRFKLTSALLRSDFRF